MNKRLNIGAALVLSALSAFGWGQKGHDVVANIAERHLTETTRHKLDSILGGKSIVYWANWLDNASHSPDYLYSLTWHYKNIDEDQTYQSAPTHSKGDITTALKREIGILHDPKQSPAERELAVKMIVHLMGDLHQPMHLGRATDLGGNKHKVKFFDTQTQLHGVWDSRLPEAGHKWSYTEWSDQLDRLAPAEADLVMAGDIDSWAEETYEICSRVYAATPAGSKIEYDYIAEWTPTVEQQFLRGGLRLSEVLNSIFDPEYASRSSIEYKR